MLTSIEHTAIDTSYGAVRTGGWIFDVSYERSASHREGDALSTQTIRPAETIHPMESGYSGSHALYQDVAIV